MEIYWIIFISGFLRFGLMASVSAIDEKCPYQTGSIYIVYPSLDNKLGDAIVNFDIALQASPNGVVFSLRAMQFATQTSNYFDYNFSVSSITNTGFNAIINLNKLYSLTYSRLILNYWSSSPLYKHSCYTRVTYKELEIQTIDLNLVYEWKIQVSDSDQDWIGHFFIPQLIAQFPNGNISLFQKEVTMYQQEMIVKYWLNPSTIIHSFQLSGIIFKNTFGHTANYTFTVRYLALQNGTQSQTFEFPDSYSQITMFIGLVSLKVQNTIPNHIGFYFGYSHEHIHNNTFQYRQAYPYLYLNKTQLSTPTIRYIGRLITYCQKRCPNDTIYLYLENSTQLCHDKCPIGKFANQYKFCSLCFNCSKLSLCPQCYQNGCNNGYFIRATSSGQYPYLKCSACNIFITNCNACKSNSSGGPYCILCIYPYYVNPTTSHCSLCGQILLNCQTCSALNLICVSCVQSSLTQLINGSCVSCNYSSYYNTSDKTCYSCNGKVLNCQTCQFTLSKEVICTSCFVSSKTFLFNQFTCEQCNTTSFFNGVNRQCNLCSNLIQNCNECQYISSVQCISCNQDLQIKLNQCVLKNATNITICPKGFYFNQYFLNCTQCAENCQDCSSGSDCKACIEDIGVRTILKNGQCIKCNNNISKLDSKYTNCFEDICPYSQFDFQTKSCEVSPIVQETIYGLTILASIPTLNLISPALASLISFFDDFSYYPYHKRNYSQGIVMFFQIMRNFTVLRFVPFQLSEFFQKISFTYSKNFLQTDINTPNKFKQNDGSIYFLITTQNFWTKNVPFTIVIFLFLMFLNYFINKFYPNKILKNYCYIGILITNILNPNIQFLAFHCFSQFFQLIPLSFQHYINLIICYLVLLLLIIYTCGSISIFKVFHKQLKQKFVFQNVFGTQWIPWFCISNMLKVFTAFVHAYFYYFPLVQGLLLIMIVIIKCIIFSLIVKRIKNKIEYAFEFTSSLTFIILQGLFMIEIYLTQLQGYSQINLKAIDVIECFLIIFMGVTQLSKLVIIMIIFIISKIMSKIPNFNKSQKDILIRKNMRIRTKYQYSIPTTNILSHNAILLQQSTILSPSKQSHPIRFNIRQRTQMNEYINNSNRNKRSETNYMKSILKKKHNTVINT